MKKLIGILVLFVAMSTTSLNANTDVTVEEIGVGGCFAMRNQAMSDALADGASYWEAWDWASAVYDACLRTNL